MPKISRKFGLGSIMIAVAVMAVCFSCLGVPGGSLAVAVFGCVAMILIAYPPEEKLRAWAWIFSIFPTLVLACLYGTWGVAWATLGHEPRPGTEPPGRLGPVVAGVEVVTRLMIFGMLGSFFGSFVLSTIESKRSYLIANDRKAAIIPFAGPVAWTVAYGLLRWDPFRVLAWFMA